MYWLALLGLLAATGFDAKTREIPNAIPACLFLSAVGAKLLGYHPLPWSQIAWGAGIALLVAGAAFYLRALGGGDVKLFTALGATLGLAAFFTFAVATSLIGGGVCLYLRLRRSAHPSGEMAYAPIMLAGLLALLPLVLMSR